MKALLGPVCAVLAMAGFGAVQSIDTPPAAKAENGVSWKAIPLAVMPVLKDGRIGSALLMEFGVTIRDDIAQETALVEALAQNAFQTAVRESTENGGLTGFEDETFRVTFMSALAHLGVDGFITDVAVTLMDERAAGLLRQPSS